MIIPKSLSHSLKPQHPLTSTVTQSVGIAKTQNQRATTLRPVHAVAKPLQAVVTGSEELEL